MLQLLCVFLNLNAKGFAMLGYTIHALTALLSRIDFDLKKGSDRLAKDER